VLQGKNPFTVKGLSRKGMALLASFREFSLIDALLAQAGIGLLAGKLGDAGWSSPVARQAHNLKVVGSNPTPATTDSKQALPPIPGGGACCVLEGTNFPR
jgi:hypothetical protein